jgi:hypothetical protein
LPAVACCRRIGWIGPWLAAEDREGLGVTSLPVLRDLNDRLSHAGLAALADDGCPQDHELPAHGRSPGPLLRSCYEVDARYQRSSNNRPSTANRLRQPRLIV